tara:strand:- start:947 stop:1411 length:465 start_codon:yes stop_codon:yes gene_type:complete
VEEFKEYDNPWQYNGSIFDGSLIRDNYGFVYCITNLSNQRQYIGRKYFWKKRKPKGGKRRVTSESDWRRYYGSSADLKQDIGELGRENFRREILSIHSTAGRVNYEETKQLFTRGVLTEALTDGTPAYYNSNILGRYYRKDYFDFRNDSSVDSS